MPHTNKIAPDSFNQYSLTLPLFRELLKEIVYKLIKDFCTCLLNRHRFFVPSRDDKEVKNLKITIILIDDFVIDTVCKSIVNL